MGTKRTRDRQASLWVATRDLPRSAGHPFYERLNRMLDDAGFDVFVERQCAPFYAATRGRPSLAPGRYFRLLLLGYFEGLDSERAIAWRAADSLSIRTFLDVALPEAPPDHSTLSRTRRLIDLETHQAVFSWVLQRLAGLPNLPLFVLAHASPECLHQRLQRRRRRRLLLRRGRRTERHSGNSDRDKTCVVLGHNVSSLALGGGRFNGDGSYGSRCVIKSLRSGTCIGISWLTASLVS